MKIRHILGICLVLAVTGLSKMAPEETEYFALFMEGKKVGHSIQDRMVADGKVTTNIKTSITISRLNVPLTMKMTENYIETTEGKPLSFQAVQELGAMVMTTSGTVDEKGIVHIKTASMGTETNNDFEWSKGAVMAEGLRLLELEKGLKEGTKYTVKVFDPSIMQVVDIAIDVGVKQNVDLLGRIVSLTEVTSAMSLPGTGSIISKTYVNEDLRPQKTIMPVAGMLIEMVACAKEFALGENDVLDVIDKLFLPSPQPLKDLSSARSLVYRLVPKQGTDLNIPSTDYQKVQRLENGNLLATVTPVTGLRGAKFPYNGTDKNILEALKPTSYLQSDRKEIIDLARRAIGDTKDAAVAVRRIESFVAEYIRQGTLSIGYATAAEVAESRQGDCSEFAVLTAALCRAAGIPARVVVGIAYVEEWHGLRDRFGGHAWTQAYIGGESGKWVGLDAAFKSSGRGGYDPGHLALAVGNGDPADFFDLVNTLGYFEIAEITINK